jgi:hypothetical protein
MAIVWSAQYPGQVSVDPNWPHGKPRNVAVPGDGSGTPLEAAWVSDLAGWQAALLQEAGITPSGQPDHLGASDYTNAIKKLAQVEFGDFTNDEHTWTAEQVFLAGHVQGNWGVGGEVVYVDPATGAPTPKEDTVRLPMNAFFPETENPTTAKRGWFLTLTTLMSGKPGWVRDPDPQNGGLYGEFALPTGARLVRVQAKVEGMHIAAGDSSIQLSTGLLQIEDDFLKERTVEKNSGVLTGSTLLTVEAATDLPWLGTFDGSSMTVFIRFTGINLVAVNWVKVVFLDPGPRNY